METLPQCSPPLSLERVHLKRNPLARQAGNQTESADSVIIEGWRHAGTGGTAVNERPVPETRRWALHGGNRNQRWNTSTWLFWELLPRDGQELEKTLTWKITRLAGVKPVSLNTTQEQNRRRREARWKVTAAAPGGRWGHEPTLSPPARVSFPYSAPQDADSTPPFYLRVKWLRECT